MTDIPYYDEHHNRLTAEGVVQSADLGSEIVYYAENVADESATFNITSDMIGKKILYHVNGTRNINFRFNNTTGIALAMMGQRSGGVIFTYTMDGDSFYSFTSTSDSRDGVIVFYRYQNVPEV